MVKTSPKIIELSEMSIVSAMTRKSDAFRLFERSLLSELFLLSKFNDSLYGAKVQFVLSVFAAKASLAIVANANNKVEWIFEIMIVCGYLWIIVLIKFL